ncbi:MAG: ankyrin repeat domain-containing protein, partial [Myxococcaceae bacterium]|nr:ankyrin repeat domain-containing protein [Myxococcaceae bacterium]
HAAGAKVGDLASVVSFVCEGGKPELVRIVLAQGPKLDVLDGNGAAPLHYAAVRGHLETARLLLEAGADPAQPAANGLSALAIAQQRNDVAMIALLDRKP